MSLLKKVLAVFTAAVIMIVSAVTAYADSDGSTSSQYPVFEIRSAKTFTMWAGTSAAIPFAVRFKQPGEFKYAVAKMTGGDKYVVPEEYQKTIRDIEDGMIFIVNAASTAAAGDYTLTVSFEAFNDDDVVIASQSFNLNLEVKSKLALKGLVIDSYTVSSQQIHPGDKFDIAVTLKNNCGIDVKDAELHLDGIDTNKFVLDKGFTKQYVDIKNGKTGTVTFSLIAQNGMTLIRENLTLNLTYSLDENRSELSRTSSTQIILNCVPSSSAAAYGSHDLAMTRYTVSSSEIEKGTKFDLTVEIKNNSANDINNARVIVNTDGNKFSIDSGLAYSDFSIKKGESKRFTFKLIGGAGITFERESIPIVMEFGSNTATVQATVSCKPGGSTSAGAKYDLTMTDYSIDIDSVVENAVFNLTFAITNSSTKKIEHARVTLMNLDGTKFAIDSGLNYSDFDILAGETLQFTFRLIGCKNLSSVREVIPIQIDYGEISNTAYATVKCIPKDSSGTDKDGKKVFAPNIMIESYDYGGDHVTAGQQFPLNVVLKNASSEAVIENLKVTVNGVATKQDGSIAFSPANSSNSFFFENITPKGTQAFSMELLAAADANPNSYPIDISFTYEYSVNKERYQATGITETITIPLRQEDRLVINEPEIPSWGVNVNEVCTINVSLVNKGKSDVYNVTAVVEGEGFTSETSSYYIGNIKSGVEEYYDAKLTPLQEGEISGNIIFTYEDSNGDGKESRIPFTFNAVSFMNQGGFDDGMYMDDPGMGMEEPQEVNWIPIILIAVGVVVVIIVIVAVVKHKKKKAELEDDDEDI